MMELIPTILIYCFIAYNDLIMKCVLDYFLSDYFNNWCLILVMLL